MSLILLTVLAVLFGMGQAYLTLIETFPTSWVYWHSRVRKPAIVCIVVLTAIIMVRAPWANGFGIHISIQALMLGTTFLMHQERMFPALEFPDTTDDLESLSIPDDAEVAIIEVGEQTRAYPLQYVIHHHVVNDRIGDRLISLTYCAMCRTVMAFDVTDIGVLFVGSYKNANLVLADRKTKTFFQQASMESIAGPLHPSELLGYPAQLLPWNEVRTLSPRPLVVVTTEEDMREFKLSLPIPGLWKRLMNSNTTPGLSASSKDSRHPARTPVIGFSHQGQDFVLLQSKIQKLVTLPEQDIFFVPTGSTVNAFANHLQEEVLDMQTTDHGLRDLNSGTTWDLRGKYQSGSLEQALHPRIISNEYWFAWMHFHPQTTIIPLPP